MHSDDIPSWVSDAMGRARRQEDWQRLADRYQSSLVSTSTIAAPQHPRFVARKMRGVYYTPAPLAERLVDHTLGPILDQVRQMLLDDSCKPEQLTQALDQIIGLRVMDPACGTGTFLVAVLDKLWRFYQWINVQLGRVAVDPQASLAQIVGVEIDPVAVEICRQRIADLAGARGCTLPQVEVLCADALRSDQLPRADIILANPPFEVLTNFAHNPQAAETARWVRSSQRFPLSGRGQINLYRLFLERCLQHIPAGGSLGIVLPLSFVGDLQGVELRRALFEETCLESLTLIPEHSRAFAGVTQGVALLVARKGGSTVGVRVERYTAADTQGSGTHSLVSSNLVKALSPDRWVIPRCHSRLVPTLERLSRLPSLVGGGDWQPVASVHVGELDQTIHRRYISDRPTERLLVRGEHMGGRYLLRLEEGGSARYVDPAFIEAGVASGSKRNHLENERLIFQGIANLGLMRRLRFALCPAGVVLGNSVNYLSLPDPGEEQVYYYLGLLNSQLMNWRFATTSYGNNVSNYEIGQLPIIRYSDAGRTAESIATAARGLTVLAAKRQLLTPAAMELDRRIDRLIYGLYEISELERELIESDLQLREV